MKIISFIVNGIMAGLFIGVGCAVNMSVGVQPLGAFMFSIGLFMVITFKFGLYTGKAGYMAVNPPSYIAEVVLTLIGNAIGAAICGALLNFTRAGDTLSSAAAVIIETKFADAPPSSFILAIFCGILMYSAVDGCKLLNERGNYAGALFAVVMPVMTFILCGFNHSIADMGYFFISGCHQTAGAALYFTLVILGNAVGCMAIPFAQKLIVNKKD